MAIQKNSVVSLIEGFPPPGCFNKLTGRGVALVTRLRTWRGCSVPGKATAVLPSPMPGYTIAWNTQHAGASS